MSGEISFSYLGELLSAARLSVVISVRRLA